MRTSRSVGAPLPLPLRIGSALFGGVAAAAAGCVLDTTRADVLLLVAALCWSATLPAAAAFPPSAELRVLRPDEASPIMKGGTRRWT